MCFLHLQQVSAYASAVFNSEVLLPFHAISHHTYCPYAMYAG